MKILIATPEAVPYAKTGGLADVTGALLHDLRGKGVEASLVLPLYPDVRKNFKPRRTGKTFSVDLGGQRIEAAIRSSDASASPKAWFIECDPLFGRPEPYGSEEGDYPDNALRFAFFSRAVPEMCCAMDIRPDVIHCNEWQTALTPLYLRKFYSGRCGLGAATTLFTIHNLGYQGIFRASDLQFTGLGWQYFTPETLEYYGKLNFMKAGLIYSDLISTVSATYAREILDAEYGFGLDGVLRKRRDDLHGVVNGIDYHQWNPATDHLLPARYDSRDLRGKRKCRKVLLAEAGLSDTKKPVFGIVSRLTSQKGLDLIADAADALVELGMNIVVAGKGDEHYQKMLKDIWEKHEQHVFVKIGYEERMARLIYAGSDFFLMPSRYEPCGVGQLIAMRYGSIPVARKTGGLSDTVEDYDPATSRGTGFLFSEYSSSALVDAVGRALTVYNDRRRMRRIVSAAMSADFSSGRTAEEYLKLYRKAAERGNA
jgi:starch synthase